MEEGDLAAGKSTAAEHGAWIVFEDEAGRVDDSAARQNLTADPPDPESRQ